jgi:hypothetical protein
MPVITEAAIKELAGFKSAEGPVVSCYLDVDGRRQVRPQDYELRMSSLMKQVAAAHPELDLSADLERISKHVKAGIDRHGVRGLAIFSNVAGGLWEVLSLPVPVSSRISVNQSPAVGPLEALVHELEPLGVLLVDRQMARMFVFHFGEVVDRTELFEALPRDYDRRDDASRGTRERERNHVDELALQHLRHSAEVAFRYLQDRGFGRLTIGATDDVYAAIEPVLHPYVKERLAQRIHAGVSSSETEIAAAARDVEHIIEAAREADAVNRLRDAVGSGNKGIAGLAPVLKALNDRRVASLLVSAGFIETGWQCACGALAALGPKCPVDGQTMTHLDDVIGDAIDVALLEGATIEICTGSADLDVLGSIGALLRY